MIAIKRLQSILWILVVAMGALSAYLISLRVATERSAVRQLDWQIYKIRKETRYLQTEFESRGSMRQLERWNAEDYRYVAPRAEQYLPDSTALASLDRVRPNGGDYVAPPVMMAMVSSDEDTPAAAAARTESPAGSQIREDERMIRVASAVVPAVDAEIRPAVGANSAVRPAVTRAAKSEKTVAPDSVARKAARMALLDERLLDDRTLREIGVQAAAEGRAKGSR